ncbi:hypothetical protein [Kitasatospora sp. MY 5-36]|nr:hypothetical protein [Kitasatospora sp. MY 5-36]
MFAASVLLLIPERVPPVASALVFVLVFLAASTGAFMLVAGWMRVRA